MQTLFKTPLEIKTGTNSTMSPSRQNSTQKRTQTSSMAIRFLLTTTTLFQISISREKGKVKYWTLKNPIVNLPKPFQNYSYSNAVIKLTSITDPYSSRIDFVISHTGTSLFDQISRISIECYTTQPFQDKDLNYYYECRPALLTDQKLNSIFYHWDIFRNLSFRLQSGSKIVSYKSLINGFYIAGNAGKDADEKVEFRYQTGVNQFKKETSVYMIKYFPFLAVYASLLIQLATLSLFAWIHDKRRVPLFTMFAVGLANFPLYGAGIRTFFPRIASDFQIFLLFLPVILCALSFTCYGVSSRKSEKTNWFGVLMLIGLTIAFLVTIVAYQDLSVALVTAVPFLLAVERLTHSKHRWLALVGWAMTAAQGMVYSLTLSSQRVMEGCLLDFESVNQNFPNKLYWAVSAISLLCCAFGPHIKISHDWKTKIRPPQMNTV